MAVLAQAATLEQAPPVGLDGGLVEVEVLLAPAHALTRLPSAYIFEGNSLYYSLALQSPFGFAAGADEANHLAFGASLGENGWLVG
jgi:hypothetical protein